MKGHPLQPVTFGQAKRLKALGFNRECNCFYNDLGAAIYNMYDNYNDSSQPDYVLCSAPLVSIALIWCKGINEMEESKQLDRFLTLLEKENDCGRNGKEI